MSILLLTLPSVIKGQSAISLKYDNLPLNEALQDLEQKYDVVFSFTSDIADDVFVNLDTHNESIHEVMEAILHPIQLKFEILDSNYIVITSQELVETRLCASFVNEIGETLSFVNIFLPSLGIGTSSDENGYLDWTSNLIGSEEVEVSYIGYENYMTDVTRLKSCPQIVLKTKQFSFEKVIVKDYVTSGIDQSVEFDHMILRPDKINMVPGLTDADVLQMIQLLPGVESIDESASGLHIRGGTPDQNLILYDGIPIYNGGHFFGMISAFNPKLVDKVDVYRSGFGPNFGGRVSSVIDIKGKNSIPERVMVDAGVNFTHGDASLAIPLLNKKVGLVLGARKSYTDIVETPTYKKLSERVFRKGKLDEVNEEEDVEVIDFGLAFDFNDYNAKLLFEPSDKDKLAFSFFKIDDNLNFDYTEFSDVEEEFSTNDKIDQSSVGWGANWERRWRADFLSRVNFSYTDFSNRYEFTIINGESNEAETHDLQFNMIKDLTIVWDNTWDLNDALRLDFGAQYADLFVERSWQFDENEEDADSELDENEIISGYLSLNSKFGNTLIGKLGLRWNHSNATKDNYFEPRISLQYLPFKDFQFRASAGFYHQFLSQVIEFNDLGINQDFWVLADDQKNIPVALSKNLSLGFIYHPNSFMLEVEGYYKQLDGLTSNLSRFTIETEADFELGMGKSWGLDVLLKKRWRGLQSWITYSYGRTQYSISIEEEDLLLNAPHDRPHSFAFVNQYKHNRWNISLSWKIASGIVYTPANGLIEEDEDPEPSYDLDAINAHRLPISHRLDLSMMYDLFHKDGLTGKLGLSLLNIYNRENLMSREYFPVFEDDENQYVLQARDRAMLRFTPNLVVRIGFK